MSGNKIPVAVAFLSFAVMGLSAGFLGVAWPSMQAGFGLPLDAVGLLLLAMTSGGILAGAASGRLVPRLGIGLVLVTGAIVGSIGQLGLAFAPQWSTVVALGFLAGIGVGTVDSSLNIYVAQWDNPRLMNWMHACFGLGATLGPLLVTAVLQAGLGWRAAYGIGAASKVFLALCFILTYKYWQVNLDAADEGAPGQGSERAKPALILLLSIFIFFLYTGIEVSAGQWSYSLFTEERGVDIVSAGWWVSIYWGVFTIGRLIFGFIVNYTRPVIILRACLLGIILGTVGLIAPLNTLSFIGLAFIGFMQAPIFPLLMSETPKRVGRVWATRAIGNQVAAAGLGIAVLPGLAGVLAERFSLEVIGPFLLLLATLMFLLHEVVVRRVNLPVQFWQPEHK